MAEDKSDLSKKEAKTPVVKEEAPKEPEVQTTTTNESKSPSWSIGGIFWGLLLVEIGVLLLLSNFGYVQLDWANVWRIWPFAIIAAGISLLSIRTPIWKFVSAILMALALVAVALLAVGTFGSPQSSYRTYSSSVQQVGSDVTNAEVTLKAGASNIRVVSDDIDVSAKATLSSNVSELRERSDVNDNTQYITFESENDHGMWLGGNFKSDWNLTLGEDKFTKLILDSGASKLDADLSRARVRELTLNAGASSSVVTLGSKVSLVKVDIDSGASSVVLRVPRDSGIKIRLDGGLVSKHMDGMKQMNDEDYESENYTSASNKIEVVADMGAANFTLERY